MIVLSRPLAEANPWKILPLNDHQNQNFRYVLAGYNAHHFDAIFPGEHMKGVPAACLLDFWWILLTSSVQRICDFSAQGLCEGQSPCKEDAVSCHDFRWN